MRFVYRDGGVEREVQARLGRPDLSVGDLAAALGAGAMSGAGGAGGGLEIDGRRLPPEAPLSGSGLVLGSRIAAATATASTGHGGHGRHGGPGVRPARPPAAETGEVTAALDAGVVLRIVGGLDAGLSAPLTTGRFRLGRGAEAEIRVECRDVSRLHCEVEVRADGRVTVADLGSRNGTDVNGVRLTGPVALGPDDVVCAAGRVPFRVLPAGALGPVQYVDPAREAGPGGTLPFNRAPRVAAPAEAGPVRLPEPPRRAEGQPLRISTIVAPLVLAGVMVLVLKDLEYALIALFSPLIMVGTVLEDRTKGGFSLRRGRREYAKRLAGARAELLDRRTRRQARLHAAFPDPAESCYRACAPGLRLWERRREAADFLVLSAGLADQEWSPPVERGRRTEQDPDETLGAAVAAAARLRQVPVAVDLSGGGVLGLEGDRAAALAAARALLCQAVVGSGPADVAVAIFADEDRIADWEWTKWLPHGTDPRAGSSRYAAAGPERCEALARALSGGFDAAGPALLVVVDGATLLEGRPAPCANCSVRTRARPAESS